MDNTTSTPVVDKWNGETVLCIPREVLNLSPEPDIALMTSDVPHGLSNLEAFLFVAHQHGRFVPRVECEHDSSLKQLIPYIVVINSGNEVLLYDRAPSGGEARLHGQTSLGVGGHINISDIQEDGDGLPAFVPGHIVNILKAANREIWEELGLKENGNTKGVLKFIGLINNDGDDVGKVHLGILFLFFLDRNEVCEFEEHLHNPRWVNWAGLAAVADKDLEAWSLLIKPQVQKYLNLDVPAQLEALDRNSFVGPITEGVNLDLPGPVHASEISDSRQFTDTERERQRDDGPNYDAQAEAVAQEHLADVTCPPCNGPGGIAGRTVNELSRVEHTTSDGQICS